MRAIAAIDAVPLDIPMRQAFGIAGGAQERANNVLVTVTLDDGTRGYGEAAPLPPFNGETQADALAAINRIAPSLLGADVRAWRAFAERAQEAGTASAACALETAALDALTRAQRMSLHAFFGGTTREIVTDITIVTGTEEEAARFAREHTAFSTLKIKVGGREGHDVALDIARVLAIANARPDAKLLLDANGGLGVNEAVHLVEALRARGVVPALFEQPVAPGNWDALAEVRARTGVPIAIDESVTRPEDVVAAHAARACDAANVKIMKSGIAAALDIVAATRACGLLPMIGGMVEARVAMGTSASIAGGLGGFAFIDLDTPLFLAEDPFEGGYTQNGERIDLGPIDIGHGCVPGTDLARRA